MNKFNIGDTVYYQVFNKWFRCKITAHEEREFPAGVHSMRLECYDFVTSNGDSYQKILESDLYSIEEYVSKVLFKDKGEELIIKELQSMKSNKELKTSILDDGVYKKLIKAAGCYLDRYIFNGMYSAFKVDFPYEHLYPNELAEDPIGLLSVAGAMIAAEIDRLRSIEIEKKINELYGECD